MTPEQQAIRQHLSKPAPRGGACGCMGPAPIDPYATGNPTFKVIVTDFGPNRTAVACALRSELQLPMPEVGAGMKANCLELPEFMWEVKAGLLDKLVGAGATCDVIPSPTARREPLCRCAMSCVEIVDGIYYRVDTHRSPDGITHTAKKLGPIGGPYTVDQYGRDL
jgi:hypothetical protein